ncbi:hypothetical protein TcWFU_005559 [Taenia crassiceps]|uniref:Uncharacterized protein n=1 Tax=Taenia crassiceps TaxID=6207 RepID=A0ABR4QDY0_9CEST
MFASGLACLHSLTARLRQILFFLLKRMDIVAFFSVAIFLWTFYTPKLSISLHLPQVEVLLFNRSLVIDNFSRSVSHNLKESLRHTDDVELFMGSYFGHLLESTMHVGIPVI